MTKFVAKTEFWGLYWLTEVVVAPKAMDKMDLVLVRDEFNPSSVAFAFGSSPDFPLLADGLKPFKAYGF